VARAHVERETLAQLLGGLQEERPALGDRAAHVVGQPAGGEGDVLAAFEDHDLALLVEAAQPGRGGHPTRYAADDDGPAPHRPKRDANQPFGACSSHEQRCAAGTPRMTSSTCWPQPLHVVLPHRRQLTAEHMP